MTCNNPDHLPGCGCNNMLQPKGPPDREDLWSIITFDLHANGCEETESHTVNDLADSIADKVIAAGWGKLSKLTDLAQLVFQMREAQRSFFRNKSGPLKNRLLIESKNLEAQVDQRIRELTTKDGANGKIT